MQFEGTHSVMAGKARRIKRSTSHIASAVESGWEEGLGGETSVPVSGDPLLPVRHHLPLQGSVTFPNSITKWGQSFPAHEPMGDISCSYVSIPQCYRMPLSSSRETGSTVEHGGDWWARMCAIGQGLRRGKQDLSFISMVFIFLLCVLGQLLSLSLSLSAKGKSDKRTEYFRVCKFSYNRHR